MIKNAIQNLLTHTTLAVVTAVAAAGAAVFVARLDGAAFALLAEGVAGAGIKQIDAKTVDFGASDMPLTDAELAKKGQFQFPTVIGGTVPVINVKGIGPGQMKLDGQVLGDIYLGKITKWNDPAIKALNPNAKLPSAAITAVHRSDNSGTTTNFTDYLAQVAPTVWTQKASGDFPTAYKGEAAKGNAGVADAIANGTNTIGYIDASKLGKLKAAKIKVGSEFVAYTPAAAAAVVAGSPVVSGRESTDMAIAINRKTTNPNEYPLVLVSYLMGCNTYADASVAALVKPYFTYLLSADGQKVAEKDAGAAPLSSAQSAAATAIVAAIK